MTRRSLILASNLHVGGGVQAAASLLDEIVNLSRTESYQGVASSLECEVSSAVLSNLSPGTADELSLREINRRPGRIADNVLDLRRRYDSVLTVFGPIYRFPRTPLRVMGYADVTSIYPDPVDTPVSRLGGARQRVRRNLSRLEASQCDVLVVETPAMRSQLLNVLGASAPRIEVVPNAVNEQIYTSEVDDSIAARLQEARTDGVELLLAFPTRAYRHKNLRVLPYVARELRRLGVTCRFIVTLRADEWADQQEAFREVSLNLGEVSVAQVSTIMRACDGVFFPSLLEAYSATPIEALALGVPVYASDRDFVRSSCGDAAVYFDPVSPDAAASAIHAHHFDPAGKERRIALGKLLVSDLPTAGDRAAAFLDVLGLTLGGRS